MRSIAAMAVLLTVSTVGWGQSDGKSTNAAGLPESMRIEAANLREVLGDDPEDVATHYQLGSLLMDNNGDLNEAIIHFELAAGHGFQPLGAAYRLSRLYARVDRKIDALEQMEIMVEGGFGQISLIDGQSDFDSIRQDARFVSAATVIRNNRFPCKTDARRRAFDFWIGQWRVTQNGQFAGTNNIAPILGDCVLLEQWSSAGDSYGKSYNYYDPSHDHWRQIWVDDSGTIIEFTGEARDGGIFFTADTTNPADGSVTLHRFEFTQFENGNVRQYWQTSNDAGKTWQTIWDGLYEKEDRDVD